MSELFAAGLLDSNEDGVLEAVRLSLVVASQPGQPLAMVGFRVHDLGSWAVPALDQVEQRLPCTVLEYRSGPSTPLRAAGAMLINHVVELNFLRYLKVGEKKNKALIKEGKLLRSYFCQGRLPLPGYAQGTNGMFIKRCYPLDFKVEAGFMLEEKAPIEHACIPLMIEAEHYSPGSIPAAYRIG